MATSLGLDAVLSAVSGGAAAFRCRAEYQPAGGSGDKVFPPTYEGGKYAVEQRRIENTLIDCVLIDSVQAQANRMESALLDSHDRGKLPLPVLSVDFAAAGVPSVGRITSLDAPHRVADAILRDSLYKGKPFRQSDLGKRIDDVSLRNATPLFELCPTALVFGLWDSTGPKGGLGAKFARAIVSEIVGLDAVPGRKTSSRMDPLQVMLQAGPLYVAKEGGWTLDEDEAVKEKKVAVKLGKDGKPSEANHGNVTPTITDGGFTISKAIQTVVLSLPALRRLRFPVGGELDPAKEDAARAVLAALGLCAATLAGEVGCDLRSRCQLVPTAPFVWELIGKPGDAPVQFSLSSDDAIGLYCAAVEKAKAAKLPWSEDEIKLTPSSQLIELVKRSQALASNKQSEVE